MQNLYHCWRGRHAIGTKTTVEAKTPGEALDRFCQRHGFEDHAGYMAHHGHAATDLHATQVESGPGGEG